MNADLLKKAMDEQGLTDTATRAGIAAICMGESNMEGYSEKGYGGTANSRIRMIFATTRDLSDEQLNALKGNDRNFFNFVYSGSNSTGKQLGNSLPEDGFNFRGRGFIQLTGRGNYTRYGKLIGKTDELLKTPDLANSPEIAAELATAYIKDRYKGGGFEVMLKCVGNNTPDIRARKGAYYVQFMKTGEFDFKGIQGEENEKNESLNIPQRSTGDAISSFNKAVQWALLAKGFFVGRTGADGLWGPSSIAALQSFQMQNSLAASSEINEETWVKLFRETKA